MQAELDFQDSFGGQQVYTTVNSSQLMDASSWEYLVLVYLPIALWMFGTMFLFILLLKKFTFGKWYDADNKEIENPYSGETFSMPRGVLRGILTMTLLFVVVFFELATVHIIEFEVQFHQFMVAFQMMIAFYFGSKVMHHVTSANRSIAIESSGISGDGTVAEPPPHSGNPAGNSVIAPPLGVRTANSDPASGSNGTLDPASPNPNTTRRADDEFGGGSGAAG